MPAFPAAARPSPGVTRGVNCRAPFQLTSFNRAAKARKPGQARTFNQQPTSATQQVVPAGKTTSMVATEGHSTILVLDYGSQYTQLITRRVREVGLFSLLFPGDASLVRNACLVTTLARVQVSRHWAQPQFEGDAL